uniref:Uncharacterized protein n=1 Tax=Anopheles arabiensis TaxID=7173 RepID=A0A182IFM2_ANOAR
MLELSGIREGYEKLSTVANTSDRKLQINRYTYILDCMFVEEALGFIYLPERPTTFPLLPGHRGNVGWVAVDGDVHGMV